MMQFLIGIDDTDNQESRGTGYRARRLGAALAEAGLAETTGITRHQLLFDPRIPYTAHNSSACLSVEMTQDRFDALVDYCRSFLLRESAPGADAGLCAASQAAVGPAVQAFGDRAKRRLLTQAQALDLARREKILLEGLTGDHGGVIGALAAVGLRAGGEDGRFIWLPGLRALRGVYTAAQLLERHIDKIVSLDQTVVPPTARIDVGDWRRPVLQNGQAVLLVEPADPSQPAGWRIAPKEIVKRY